jgi:PAS domain S-box-containing protein
MPDRKPKLGHRIPIGRRAIVAASVCVNVAGLTAAALALSLLLEPWIEPDFAPLFLGAVALSSRRWGMRAGIVSTLITIPALLVLYLPPHYTLNLVSWAVALRLLSFLSTAALIIWLVERFVRAQAGLRATLEDIRTREERFRVALLHSPVVVFHQNADLRYIWVYNPFPEHTGVTLLNKLDSDLFPAAEAAELTRIKKAVLATGRGVREEVVLHGRGGLRTMDVMIEPFNDSAGNTVGLLGTAVDITEQKLHEEQLERRGEQFRKLTRYLHSTHEDERALTSREIHDNVSQMLAAVGLEIATIARAVADGVPRHGICDRLRALNQSLSTTIESSERISADLRPSLLDNLGLASAIASAAREFEARTGIPVVAGPLEPACFCPEIATAIFRIVQETLTNIERHAGATLITISLHRGFAGLMLRIHDNGRAASMDSGTDHGSLILLAMRERAGSFGGRVTVHSTRGEGTTTWIEIPAAATAPSGVE